MELKASPAPTEELSLRGHRNQEWEPHLCSEPYLTTNSLSTEEASVWLSQPPGMGRADLTAVCYKKSGLRADSDGETEHAVRI